MEEELLSLKWTNHQSHFVDFLTFLREQEIFVDTTLACGGKLYAAHKFVLSFCSDYFKQMFTNNPSKHPIVYMNSVSTHDLEALLDFMYNGEVTVSKSILGSVMKTAEGLQIKGLAVNDHDPRKMDSKPQENCSPSPSKRPRLTSPIDPLPSSSLAQSSYTPTPSSRSHSPLPLPTTQSGELQNPNEATLDTLDKDNRTSIQSDHHSIIPQRSNSNGRHFAGLTGVCEKMDNNTKVVEFSLKLEHLSVDELNGSPNKSDKYIKVEEIPWWEDIKIDEILEVKEENVTKDDSAIQSKKEEEQSCEIHTRKRPCYCRLCGKAFLENSLLTKHMRIHTGIRKEPYQCSQCDKAFLKRIDLQMHMGAHVGERPYRCDQCDKSFSDKSTLVRHVRIHTGERPYHCKQREESFIGTNTLINHKGTHTLERPYNCSQCEKSFLQKSELNEHMSIHTGDRPYQCDQCDKSFSDNKMFIRHMKIHTGERPYQCCQCEKSFSDNSILLTHMLKYCGSECLD